jgi:hypothetical protein
MVNISERTGNVSSTVTHSGVTPSPVVTRAPAGVDPAAPAPTFAEGPKKDVGSRPGEPNKDHGGDVHAGNANVHAHGGNTWASSGDTNAHPRGGNAWTPEGDAHRRGGNAQTHRGDSWSSTGDTNAHPRGGNAQTHRGDSWSSEGNAQTHRGDSWSSEGNAQTHGGNVHAHVNPFERFKDFVENKKE